MIEQLSLWLRLIRAHQFIKNLFIFLPIFFAGVINQWSMLFPTILAFIAFCCVTAAVYIFNDVQDIEDDKRHPNKKNRPLATGAISISKATIFMVLMYLMSGLLMAMVSKSALLVMVVYALMNVAYSLYLKRLAIIDVCIIAIGFVLRLFVGSSVTSVPLSMWIVLMTFLLALFLALGKRHDDVLHYEMTGEKLRAAVNGYNLLKLDMAMFVIAIVTVFAYVMYTLSPEITSRLQTDYLYLSAVFVLMGLSRYAFLVMFKGSGHSPIVMLFNDRPLQWALVMWLSFFVWVLY